tara:strand:+ start:238 stop:396 length:159 start_codon:yes stop_codon:yes gene_type:complete
MSEQWTFAGQSFAMFPPKAEGQKWLVTMNGNTLLEWQFKPTRLYIHAVAFSL